MTNGQISRRLTVPTVIFITIMVICPVFVNAQDQMVTYVAEHYREQQTESGFKNRIYHTLQVDTGSGSKLLVLTGDDYEYRAWLREYLSRRQQLLLVIPDSDGKLFQKSRVYELDVTSVHPVVGETWKQRPAGLTEMPPFTGEKHIMVVDPNARRRELVSLILTSMGYPVSVAGSGPEAWTLFQRQPDKFRLLIADTVLPGVSGVSLVRKVVDTVPELPVILATGYRNPLEQSVINAFTGLDNVMVVPLVLRELPQTVGRLLNRKA